MAAKAKGKKKKGQQKSTNRRLTPKQQILLEALMDPANRLKSISELCGLLKMDRKTYYQAWENPEFVRRHRAATKGLAERHAAQVLNSFVREATRGSYQHGKVILEMAGVYQPKEVHELTGKGGGPIQTESKATHDLSQLSTEELRNLATLVSKAQPRAPDAR